MTAPNPKHVHFSAQVPCDLRERFHVACCATNRKASAVVRDFMADYEAEHQAEMAEYLALTTDTAPVDGQ